MPESSQITLLDVAKAAGISKATASRALSGQGAVSPGVRKAVHAAANELGFEINPYAQRLSTGIARNVVGLFSLTLDYMAWQTMSHLHHELAELGYEAPLYTYGYSLEDWPDYHPLLSSLRRQLPQGIICNTFKLPPKATEELLQYQQRGGTLVCLHSPFDIACDQIIFDREEDVRLAIRHLIEAGHHKIGLGGLMTNHDQFLPRMQGYLKEMKANGISPDSSWLFDAEVSKSPILGSDEAQGAALAKRYCQNSNPPKAMCIINDIAAATFVHQLLAKGYKVPDDVSVVAVDGMPITRYSVVKITTVSQPLQTAASKAVGFLQERLNGTYQGKPRKLVYHGEVMARDSVKRV